MDSDSQLLINSNGNLDQNSHMSISPKDGISTLLPPAKSIERKRKIYGESVNESLFSISAKSATPEINSNSQIKPIDKDVTTLIDIIGCPRNEKKIMLQLGYLSTIQDILLARDTLKQEKMLSIKTRALLLTFVNWMKGGEMRDVNEYEECIDDRENEQYHKATLFTLSPPTKSSSLVEPQKLIDTEDENSTDGDSNNQDSSIISSYNIGYLHESSCGSDPEGSLWGYEDDGFVRRG